MSKKAVRVTIRVCVGVLLVTFSLFSPLHIWFFGAVMWFFIGLGVGWFLERWLGDQAWLWD